ncbi:MAG: hypothetical protein WCP28_07560 [Actinomycetes bacterium]
MADPAPLGETEVDFVNSSLRVFATIWVSFGLTSLAFLELTDPSPADVSFPEAHLLILAGLAACAVAMVLALMVRRLRVEYFVATMTATAMLSIFISAPVSGAGQAMPLAVAWTTLAAFSAALLLRFRFAWRAIIFIALASNALIVCRLSLAGMNANLVGDLVVAPAPLKAVTVEPLRAAVDIIGIAMGVAFALKTWREMAADRDAAALEATIASANAEIVEERSRHLKYLIYGLHDTVINTLGAVSAGVSPDQVDTVARRAQHDLEQMEARITGYDPDAHELSIDGLFKQAQGQAERLQVAIEISSVSGHGDSGEAAIPQRVLRGMKECISEAILNISKHAPKETATLSIERAQNQLTVIVGDSGPGLPGGTPPPSLVRRATADGIRVTAASDSGPGAHLAFIWEPNRGATGLPERPGDTAAPGLSGQERIARSLQVIACSIGAWVGGAYLIDSLIATAGGSPVGATIPVILGAVLVALACLSCIRWFPLPGPLLLVLIAGIPCILLLSYLSAVQYGVNWTALAALLTFIVVLLSAQPWQGVSAAIIYTLTNGALVSVALVNNLAYGLAGIASFITDLAGLLAIMLLRRRIEKYFSEAAITARQTEQARSSVAALQKFTAASVTKNNAMLARSRELLTRLASREASPLDPSVRLEAKAEESYLRSMLAVDPNLGPLADELFAIIDAAHQNQVMLRMTILSTRWKHGVAPPVETVVSFGQATQLAVKWVAPATKMAITVDASNDHWLSMVIPSDQITADRARAGISRIGLNAEVTDLGDQTLIEYLEEEAVQQESV